MATRHRQRLHRHHPARRQGRPDRPNGAGKTTLLKMILGELAPDSGVAKLGTKLQVAYFDQMRTSSTRKPAWSTPSRRAATGSRSTASAST
jgi:ATPase subunit of ABC transporter with duplicated ATPase domains